MKEKIKNLIIDALKNLEIDKVDFVVEHPEDLKNGDYSTNVAMVYSKEIKTNPKELAEKIVNELNKKLSKEIEKVEIAGAGFINFYLSRKFFLDSVKEILEKAENFGKNNSLSGQKVMVEFTDPNPFKEFHIGHLMPNVIGESISRIITTTGAEVKKVNYQGDVGMHVACAVWGIKHKDGIIQASVQESAKYLGECYALGSSALKEDEKTKKEIQEINKKLYEKSDPELEKLYEWGKSTSLSYFETMYTKLGSHFDFYFFESEVGGFGKETVLKFLDKGIFEKSDGAVIFHGEKYGKGLHTRVFVNSEGLPTYEAKELGLAKVKYDKYPYDKSIIITGNEIDSYFQVLLVAMNQVFPDLAKKTTHISHGMLRLPSGKMSSRTGNVITAETLIGEIKEKILEKIKDREFSEEEKEKITEIVAIGAIKYSILHQSTGGDIIFDFEKSLSFEGDSGPYLQYSATRAKSVLTKAQKSEIFSEVPEKISDLEKTLYRFPEIVLRSYQDLEPHHIATYLTELASSFNSFYAQTQIINSEDKYSPYYLSLTKAFLTTMQNGLYLLGIKLPDRM